MRKEIFTLIFFSCLILVSQSCGTVNNPAPSLLPDTRPLLYWSGKTVTSAETFSGYRIYATGNISVESGGSLTLNYVTLYLSCETDAQYGIFVNSGGTFIATHETILTAYHTAEAQYAFWFKDGSSGGIYNSTVEAAWMPTLEAGLYVQADNFAAIGSTLKNSKGVGLWIEGTVEAYIFNNLIQQNYSGLKIQNNPRVCTLEGNRILNNTANGINIDHANLIFYGNSVSGNQRGVYIRSHYGSSQLNFGNSDIPRTGFNDFSNNTTAGIYNGALAEFKAQNNFWGYFSPGAIQNYNQDQGARLDVSAYLFEKP